MSRVCFWGIALRRIGFVALAAIPACSLFAGTNSARGPLGLESRPVATAFLNMPQTESGVPPRLLSQTGAFRDARTLSPVASLIPYDLNVAFWSDGASKSRWISVPFEKGNTIRFSPTGEWVFPRGTVFVKHFEIGTNEAHPSERRRLETRLLVCDATGGVYGVTYKWRPDYFDADLLTNSLYENILIKTASGFRTQRWYYPSGADCRTCHTTNAGGVLGVKTRQLNREYEYEGGRTDNQLRAWSQIGLFDGRLKDEEIHGYPKLARLEDKSAGLQERVRSYLDANCSQCHRPGGAVAYFDARYDTPLDKQNLIDKPVVIDQGIDNARAIAPNDIWRSIIFMRINTLEPIKMPPLAHETMDWGAVALVRDWIQSLPGPEVLDPPAILPKGGEFGKKIRVTLAHNDPRAELRYTLDGEVPNKSAQLYQGPIELTGPATVRARAYRAGFTRSITVQETFILGE